jgi:hypothetical protein
MYSVDEPSSGSTTLISVPMSARPKRAPATRRFKLTWATGEADPGFVYDVQIKRPGSTAFRSWKTGVNAPSGRFRPDRGTGTYTFRARLRSMDGKMGWSPLVSIRATQA